MAMPYERGTLEYKLATYLQALGTQEFSEVDPRVLLKTEEFQGFVARHQIAEGDFVAAFDRVYAEVRGRREAARETAQGVVDYRRMVGRHRQERDEGRRRAA